MGGDKEQARLPAEPLTLTDIAADTRQVGVKLYGNGKRTICSLL